MSTLHDTYPQLAGIDEQLIDLLSDRVQRCAELELSDSAVSQEEEADMLIAWQEMAADAELDEALMEKVFKLILLLSRRSGE